jgi:DNA-binding transcriptional LysR family regulator
MASQPVLGVQMVTVVSPSHPLGQSSKPIPTEVLKEHVQLVLTDRSSLSDGRSFGVFSAQTWHLADLGAKHAFLKAGFGWGHMPLQMVEEDLASGALTRIRLKALESVETVMHMVAIFRQDDPPGPAGSWFLEQLQRKTADAGEAS